MVARSGPQSRLRAGRLPRHGVCSVVEPATSARRVSVARSFGRRSPLASGSSCGRRASQIPRESPVPSARRRGGLEGVPDAPRGRSSAESSAMTTSTQAARTHSWPRSASHEACAAGDAASLPRLVLAGLRQNVTAPPPRASPRCAGRARVRPLKAALKGSPVVHTDIPGFREASGRETCSFAPGDGVAAPP